MAPRRRLSARLNPLLSNRTNAAMYGMSPSPEERALQAEALTTAKIRNQLLREQIEDGIYDVPAVAVADRLLEHFFPVKH